MKRAVLLFAFAACGSSSDGLRIDGVEPAYSPLAGGTRIVITGAQFTDGVGPTRVLIGGRLAPLANAIDETTLEVVVPPGEQPGDAELVVFNQHGAASASFHYATVPTIASVTPADILYNAPAMLTLTGSGFLDDGAGEPMVLFGGTPAQGVTVISDSELRFVVGPGRALDRPRVEVINARGVAAKDRAFRYRPSMRSGLLLFTQSSQTFAVFYDPVDNSRVEIPRVGPFTGLSSVVVDENGDYWATERFNGGLGRLELATQRFEQPMPFGARMPAMARIDGMQYGFDRWTLRFGRFGIDTPWETIGSMVAPCCGGYGVAYDGTTLYFTFRSGADKFINPLDHTTGAAGTPVKLVAPASLHIEDMRFFGAKLYAASRDGTLVEIDPSTGVVSTVTTILRTNAMEVFE